MNRAQQFIKMTIACEVNGKYIHLQSAYDTIDIFNFLLNAKEINNVSQIYLFHYCTT